MKRRDALRAAVGLGLGASAGCLDFVTGGDGASTTRTTGRPGPGSKSEEGYPSLVESGFPSTVCEEGTQPSALLEIVDPSFADDWPVGVDASYGTDGRLAPEEVVIGRTGGDRPRAYPLSILWFHEVVADEYDGEPALVTYNSLSRTGMVASRVVDGDATAFRATGLLWQPPEVYAAAADADNLSFGATTDDPNADVRVTGNLVLVDDATGSYWSQLLARAICGPLEGTVLDVLSQTVSSWGEWRRSKPETEVLLPPPYSGLEES